MGTFIPPISHENTDPPLFLHRFFNDNVAVPRCVGDVRLDPELWPHRFYLRAIPSTNPGYAIFGVLRAVPGTYDVLVPIGSHRDEKGERERGW